MKSRQRRECNPTKSVCNQSEEYLLEVITYTLRVITYALRGLHANPSDWIKIKGLQNSPFIFWLPLLDLNQRPAD